MNGKGTTNNDIPMYLRLENPTLFIALTKDDICRNSAKYTAIMDAVHRAPDVGIHNIVAKVDNFTAIERLLYVTEKMHDICTTFRVKSNNWDASFEEVETPRMAVCLDCEDELETFVRAMHGTSAKTPLLVKVTDQNVHNLVEVICNQETAAERTVIISAGVEFGNVPKSVKWYNLEQLYCKVIELQREFPNRKILMDYGILPTRLLTEHPCNAYVCSRATCHSGKNNLPRRIFVNEVGDLCPEHINISSRFYLGNIFDSSLDVIFTSYQNSDRHAAFLKLAKDTYLQWVATSPYRVIPWSSLLVVKDENRNMIGENNGV